MKPINVLVVTGKYPPEYAGSGLRAHNTYKRLSEKFPVTFEVLTSSVAFNQNKTYRMDGIKVTRIAKKPFPEAISLRKKIDSPFLMFIEKLKHACNYLSESILTWKYLTLNIKRFNLIHIFGNNWVTASTITFAKIIKKPFIVELCNCYAPTRQYEPWLFRTILGERFPENTVKVCISERLRQLCERYGYKENVWSRPNPVDEKKFFIDKENKMKFRKKYTSFGADDILLTCVSYFIPRKNQIFLLDVMRRLPEEYKLLLAGPTVKSGPLYKRDSDYLKSIKDKIIEYRLESRVQLEARFIDNIDEYLKMSDAFLFPVTDEGLGTPMLEAISCGIPVVANRIPGVTDSWIEDGKTGVLSDLNADEFPEKVRKVSEIYPTVLKQKRDEVISHCSTEVIDEEYFRLIKNVTKKG